MPSALTFSSSSRRSSSILLSVSPRAFLALTRWMSTGAMIASLAITVAFSGVPPMPRPRMPGGHQPAPIVGTVLSTQSTIESLGLRQTIFDLFSLPPPLAAQVTST